MNYIQDKIPRNEKGQAHGHWRVYYSNGQIAYKGSYVSGIKDGYWEYYYISGGVSSKGNYVNDAKVSLWIEHNEEVFYAN